MPKVRSSTEISLKLYDFAVPEGCKVFAIPDSWVAVFWPPHDPAYLGEVGGRVRE